MREYFDGLDAAPQPVPRDERVAAALGPKMLDLAAERWLGAHPYFTTPDHTRFARDRVGPEALVAPDLAVVVDPVPERARERARSYAATYLRLRNYTTNLLRFGFTERDLAGGGSDRLIDAVVPHGDAGGGRRGGARAPRRRRRPRVPPAARARRAAGRGPPRAGRRAALTSRPGRPARCSGMDLQLSGRVAVVTGASKGIGLAVTRTLLAEGARVVAALRARPAAWTRSPAPASSTCRST